MHIPAATSCTIDAMRTSYHFIMLVAVAVKLFPLTGFGRNDIFYPIHFEIFMINEFLTVF